MYGYIYLTTNLTNNKRYIGQHKSEEFDIKYFGSGKILQQAIKKDGIENFTCKLLCECFSEEELNLKEAYYIKLYDAVNSKDFYNLVPGGYGRSISGVIYITNGVNCKKIFPEELEIYESQGWWKGGPKPTKETIEKRASKLRGIPRTCGDKISKTLKGRKLTEEQRSKISKAKKGKISSTKGRISVIKNGIARKILPEELTTYLSQGYSLGTKKHLKSDSSAKHSAAMQNRTYITNGIQIKHVLNDQLQLYLAQGWQIGRKLK